MTSPEVAADIDAMDGALRATVRDLNQIVGRRGWVLLLTADHGFTPAPKQSGAWPISGRQLKDDANREFDAIENGADIVFRVTSAGIYVHPEEMELNLVTSDDIGKWLLRYKVTDNATALPSAWADRGNDALFDAVLVGKRVAANRCTPSA
jgi:hypothetical protein